MRTNIFRELMQSLSGKQSFSEDFVFPDYQRLNVKNILPQVGAIFNIRSLDCPRFPEDYLAETQDIQKVFLIILDGLGYNRFLHYLNKNNGTFVKLVKQGIFKPLTTVFPSTTSTALTSIFTGLTPAEHQIIGYHMFSKKYGLVYNTLDMKPIYGYHGKVELAKEYSQQVKPWLPILEQNGIKALVVTKASIAGSGLSQVIHKDTRLTPYLLGSDMLMQLSKALKQQGPALVIVYYSGVDTLAHRYGPYSEEITFELNSIEHNLRSFISRLSDRTKKETLMVLTADHGLAEVRQTYFLKDVQDVMMRLMLPPVGDGRAAYLFSKNDQREALSEAFKRNVDGFKLFSSKELIDIGVFGKPIDFEGLKEKVGDYVALSNSQNILQYPFFEADRFHQQLGAHGGMTGEEMIVPLLSVRLSNFDLS